MSYMPSYYNRMYAGLSSCVPLNLPVLLFPILTFGIFGVAISVKLTL